MNLDHELQKKELADFIRSKSAVNLDAVSNNQIVEIAKICGLQNKPVVGTYITKKYSSVDKKTKGNYILPIRYQID